jgi:uncharacterized membrane protein HdeD (DUF308 family)
MISIGKPSLPPLIGTVLLVTGLLLFYEVIRPFRDLEIDGLLALVCWGLAVLVNGIAIWRKLGSRALNLTVLLLNLLVLTGVLALLMVLSSSMRLF